MAVDCRHQPQPRRPHARAKRGDRAQWDHRPHAEASREGYAMIAAICLFLVGACAGAFLAIRHFRRLRLPGWVAIAHGAAGATGFAILLFVFAHNPGFAPARYGTVILIGAIGLGCVNVVYHLRKLRHRTTLIVVHALSAVAGVGTLTYGVFVSAATARGPAPELRPEPVQSAAPVASATPPA